MNHAAASGNRPSAATDDALPWSRSRVGVARRRLLADRLATWVVTAGGIAIIVGILAILMFIVIEVAPLLLGARVQSRLKMPLPGGSELALLGDEYGTQVAALGLDGIVRVIDLKEQRLVASSPARTDGAGEGEDAGHRGELLGVQVPPRSDIFVASRADGAVLLLPLAWRSEFTGQTRSVKVVFENPLVFEVDPGRRPLGAYTARQGRDGSVTAVGATADGSLVMMRRVRKENLFTGEVEESVERNVGPAPSGLAHLLLDDQSANLYGATASGDLYWWVLGRGLHDPQVVSAGAPVTALSLLVGGRSLVVGQADGSLSVWFVVRRENGPVMTRIRDFPPHGAAVRLIAASRRNKGFLAADDRGGLGLYHSTSERVLWTGQSPIGPPSALAYAVRADGAYVSGGGELATLGIDNPHPEVSLGALFARIWYEGYDRPEFAWQSSSGTDDFEPKLSLTPLMVGTLKGTVYSLLIAIPLAVFGAMYTSQFMHPSLKRVVKPTVEIMAALPSVVLGFLAGLWLAPQIERAFPALLVMVVLLPALNLLAGAAWQLVPRRFRGRVPTGSEAIVFLVVLAGGVWLSLLLGRPLEILVFGGSFPAWLLESTGLRYDQRNAIVVGLAMGFAVIPIIFAIAEDAFSNVPRELVSGSLALGANRWQTVTRVVLPTASPGIFSAIMVGFGRAVGETMIVLMATGNTPILDWNPFNGFRTLSANIAVEIPEAPQGGTLYRVLFLAALLLFVVTFVVNTAAEVVRGRLRRRYARL